MYVVKDIISCNYRYIHVFYQILLIISLILTYVHSYTYNTV